MKRYYTRLLFVLLSTISSMSFSENNFSLEAGYNYTAEMKDGTSDLVKFNTPGELLLPPHKNSVYIFDNNGYKLRVINKDGSVKTTNIDLHNFPKKSITTLNENFLTITNACLPTWLA